MNLQEQEFEGTWEEIIAQKSEFVGKRVRVMVVADEAEPDSLKESSNLSDSTAQSLLKYAGTWQGEDFKDCLNLVYQTRTQL